MSETKPLSKQNKYDNSHKEAKKAQRQITNWLKAAEKEQSTGLPIGRKVKGDERELQQRIYAAARTAKVDSLARARTFLREFNEARNAPTPPLSDPISFQSRQKWNILARVVIFYLCNGRHITKPLCAQRCGHTWPGGWAHRSSVANS